MSIFVMLGRKNLLLLIICNHLGPAHVSNVARKLTCGQIQRNLIKMSPLYRAKFNVLFKHACTSSHGQLRAE